MIRTALTEEFGIEVPVFAFTPSKAVAAAVTRAGGLGVLGCVRYNDPAELDEVLTWMDSHTDGKPYGVDVVMPNKVPTEGSTTDLDAMIPEQHKGFVNRVLDDLGVPPLGDDADANAGVLGWLHSVAQSHVDVALTHRPVLIANALGSPPAEVTAQCQAAGLKVAALAGTVEQRGDVRVVVGDESVAPWLRNQPTWQTLLKANPLFRAEVPFEDVPVNIGEFSINWIFGGGFYVMSFTVADAAPEVDLALPMPGKDFVDNWQLRAGKAQG